MLLEAQPGKALMEAHPEVGTFILVVDRGGSKCDALLCREDGTAIARGRSGIEDPEGGRGVSGSGRSRRTLERAVSQALADFSPAFLHHNISPDPGPPIEPLRGSFETMWHPVREQDCPMELAGLEWGVVAIAGTGALVYARSPEGREVLLDGLGPELGDHGGGYQIGREAMRAAACSGWSERRRTSLAEPVYRACTGESPEESGWRLVDYSLERRDRAEIAALARIVDQEAEKGDSIALRILRSAAADLAQTILDAAESAALLAMPCTVALSGGVGAHSRLYAEHLQAVLAEHAPALQVVQVKHPPVIGAALVILRRISGEEYPARRARLLETAGELFRTTPRAAQRG
ncbi:MAG: BadF/BadG/BcrA/BcrD ATPase family protein [Armatimonadota bacterium]